MPDHYDVIVIGSGAGGGTLARTLAPSGKRILLLERGNRGAAKLHGAALCRLRPADFGEIRHRDGLSPAWPLSYAEFEPWYARAERMYQVHGLHGEDPSEGPWSEEYPWPPISHEPPIQRIADDLDRAGYYPFHVPRGIVTGGSTRLNVTLLTGAEVTRLETDPAGRSVTRVIVTRAGAREEYRGDLVVLAAGAVNSARVLLRSACDRHPAGLANGSGQVGRNYLCHTVSDVVALGEKANDAVFQQTLGINAFYLAGDSPRANHLAGYGQSWPLGSIQLLPGNERPEAWPPPARRLFPGPCDIDNRAVGFRLITEDLPRPDNRVTVDSRGHPWLAYDATNTSEAAMLYHELGMMLSQADLQVHRMENVTGPAGPGTDDQAGTCRFGRDPAVSVLDVNCKAHELDNLYVADASFFPSVGAVGPALTTMANAIRVGEHLIRRLG